MLNLGIFRTLAYMEPNAYLEFCQISKAELFSKTVRVNIFSKYLLVDA